jgi:predicted PurR-regulated permease PerM
MLKGIGSQKVRRIVSIILSLLMVLIVLSAVIWLLLPELIKTIGSIVPTLLNFVVHAEASIREFLENNPDRIKK